MADPRSFSTDIEITENTGLESRGQKRQLEEGESSSSKHCRLDEAGSNTSSSETEQHEPTTDSSKIENSSRKSGDTEEPSTSKKTDDLSTPEKDSANTDTKEPERRGSTSEEPLKTKEELVREERQRMQVLVSAFSEDQLDRYEMYRRACFPKATIKKLMQSITGTTVSQNVVIAMSGVAKVYVGEIVEQALDVKEQWGDSGALEPKHIREAVRRLKNAGKVPNTQHKKVLFK